MTGEQWRAAVARWGDPTYGLALLLTNERVAAESMTINTFAQVLASSPAPELDHALYTALWKSWSRRRLPRLQLRNRVLPPALARIDKTDRFLLGLWLLRNVEGPHIAGIVGLPQQQVIERLAAVVARADKDSPSDTTTGHITLRGWLEQQLNVTERHHSLPDEHPRVCRECQAAQASWLATRDELRTLLRDALRQQHLPFSSVDAIEDALHTNPVLDADRWWYRRRIWLPALIASVGVLLAVLVVPRNGGINTAQSPATSDPRVIIEAALKGWTADPAAPLHRQVWARDTRLHSGEPVVTDVWLDSAGNPRHRVEVRRGSTLVEWQVADGRSRFDYAAEVADSSCRWNTGWRGHYGKLDGAPARFSLPRETLREIRDARLQQGAYGLGYITLQRALEAEDLRSFGTRTVDNRTLVVLRYTDQQVQPPRQLVLQLDADTQQLDAVQEVQVIDNQAKTLDIWRVERDEILEEAFPLNIPSGPRSITRDNLVDPACPALNVAYIAGPRALWESAPVWYVPRSLPSGITRLMLLREATTLDQRGQQGFENNEPTLLLSGPGRWLSISYSNTRSDLSSEVDYDLRQGIWQISLDPANTNGLWHARLKKADDQERGFVRPLELWARGWTQDELLAFVETLGIMDSPTWLAMQRHFVDPEPLPADVQQTVVRALTALQPEPNQTLVVGSTTTVRTDPDQIELPDPYHLPATQAEPATVMRRQTLRYQHGHIEHYHDRRTLPDTTIYEIQQDNGSRFHWYSSLNSAMYTGGVELLRAFARPEQAQVEALTTLMTSENPPTMRQAGDTILLEQRVDPDFFSRGMRSGPWTPHDPWMQGLGIGDLIRRVWLDPETSRPIATSIVHQRQDTFETLLIETKFDEWQQLDAPPADMFTLPRLPEGVFTLDVSDGNATIVDQIEPPQRMLSWSDRMVASEFERITGPWNADDITEQHIRGSWLRPTGLAGSVTMSYQIEPVTELHFTQAPRTVLRHVLRDLYNVDQSGLGAAWTSSRSIPVTVAGEQREAWLLQGEPSAVLVVEIDELALHFSGPIDFLTGPLVELLPQLEWTSAPPP